MTFNDPHDMVTVQFTPALRRFFPDLTAVDVQGETVREVLNGIEAKYPGMKSYLMDDQGSLRQHVNIFVGGARIEDDRELSDSLQPGDEVYVMQALSGG
ncbi:MAG: MoaD/ThiS family protein [Bacteroidota bacterium]